MVTPDGAAWAPRPRVDNAMVKALARAFRWRKMLDEGVHATLEDLARAKGVHATYVSRILRLTLLAPEIVPTLLAMHLGFSATVAIAVALYGLAALAFRTPAGAAVSPGRARRR